MNVDNRIVHESDVNLLPEGATIIKSVYESTYEQVSYIVQLYDLEEQYRLRHLAPGQIQQERQGEKTSKIITQIRQRLDKLLADGNGMRGDLMQKALNYLRSFWDQLFLYIKDGRYCIDNSLAERTLRPMTVERKNSLTFGSHAGAKVSVIYHTFIETCKMCGVSTLEYFKEFFKAIIWKNSTD